MAHQIVVIGPDNGDEQITHCVTEPRRPEREERVKGGKLRWPQVQNQHGYKNSEYAVGERAQSLRGRSVQDGHITSWLAKSAVTLRKLGRFAGSPRGSMER